MKIIQSIRLLTAFSSASRWDLIVSQQSFEFNTYLESVIVPDGVTSLGRNAFYDCTSLTSITIPKTVTWIGNHCFDNCIALRDVYYEGTAADWDRIDIEGFKDELENATIHFLATASIIRNNDDRNEYDNGLSGTDEQSMITDDTPMPDVLENEYSEPNEAAEPTPVTPDFLLEEEFSEPEEEYIEPQGSIDGEPADIDLLAAHSPSSVGSNTALFTGLEAGKDYILIVAVNINAVNLLAPDNLLFIAQTAADNSGRIAFAYTPRKNGGTARAYGPGSWTSQSTPPATFPSNGWFTDANGDKYYYKNGKALKGWGYVDAEWYYFDNTGRMVTGDWAQDSRGWYFLGADGKMMSGFREINLGRADDGWYYFNTKHDGSYGRVLSGWQLINGDWYYFNEKHNGTYGRMVTSDWAVDSKYWYFLGPDGKMLTGLREINLGRADDGLYYFNTKHDGTYGRMMTGWQTIDGNLYFFETRHNGSFGKAFTNSIWTINGWLCGFDEYGVCYFREYLGW